MNAQFKSKREYKIFIKYPLRKEKLYDIEIIMKQKEGQRFFFHTIVTKCVSKRILINVIINRNTWLKL